MRFYKTFISINYWKVPIIVCTILHHRYLSTFRITKNDTISNFFSYRIFYKKNTLCTITKYPAPSWRGGIILYKTIRYSLFQYQLFFCLTIVIIHYYLPDWYNYCYISNNCTNHIISVSKIKLYKPIPMIPIKWDENKIF